MCKKVFDNGLQTTLPSRPIQEDLKALLGFLRFPNYYLYDTPSTAAQKLISVTVLNTVVSRLQRSASQPSFRPLELASTSSWRYWEHDLLVGGIEKSYFCNVCGNRLMHNSGRVSCVKGVALNGLTKGMLKKAAHLWTKRAVVNIPTDAEQYDGNPPDDD